MTKELSVTEIQNATALSAKMLTQDKAQAYELVGMLKMSAFTKKLVTVTEIKLLAEIKESKQYKELTIYNSVNGVDKNVTVTTFKEFCEALGMSYEKVNLDIQNLNALGEDFLETSQRIGLGYRDLRKLRKLPEEERDLIINGETFKAKDKEELVEFIEEKVIAYAKEKETLEKQVSELKADASAKETIIVDKNKKIDDLSVKLEKKAKKIELDDDTEREKIETFQAKWGEVFGELRANVYHARQLVERVMSPEEDYSLAEQQKPLVDVCHLRDQLLEMIDLLPYSAEPVDTSWLTDDKPAEEQ